MTPNTRARDLMTTEPVCAYEGWSLQRLADSLNRQELARVPVIASDHQLVGSVGLADIYRLMNSDETYRAQLINDSFRRATGHEVENLDELTARTRRAQVYCTVHQIMQKSTTSVELGAKEAEVRSLLRERRLDALWVTDAGVLVGVIHARDLL